MTDSRLYPVVSRPSHTQRALLLLIGVLLISAQFAPSVMDQRRDSGIFAYTAQVIGEGGLPYVDAWDNKLPSVFYIDAAAFALFDVNGWAIWLADTAFVFGAAWVLGELVARVYGRRDLAWIGALLLAVLARHPALVPDTNFTETYALLPQVIVWAAGYQFLRTPNHRLAFMIGAAAGIALLIKQTTVGDALALVPAALIVRPGLVREVRYWRWLGTMIAGGLASLGLMAAHLALNGILDDAIRASFLSAGDFHAWVGRGTPWIGATVAHSLITPEIWVTFGPLLPFMLIGGWQVRDRTADPAERTCGVWLLLALVVNLTLANVTDRAYEHYYMPLIPAVVLLTAGGLRRIPSQPPPYMGEESKAVLRGAVFHQWPWALFYIWTLIVLLPVVVSIWRLYEADWALVGPARVHPLAAYVAEQTAPGDFVYVWGANTLVNFQADRRSPTAYTYAYPLIMPGADSERRIAQVIADLDAHPPALIVDSTWTDGRRIPPLDAVRRAVWEADGGRHDVADLTPIYAWVADRCTLVDMVEDAAIYRCE